MKRCANDDETREQAATRQRDPEETDRWLRRSRRCGSLPVTGLARCPNRGFCGQLWRRSRLYVTYDPVTLSDGSPEDEDYIRNESLSDTRTLPVAESTFYGIEESRAVPITQAELMAKAAPRDNPRLFDFYVLDGEVYMIAERYLP